MPAFRLLAVALTASLTLGTSVRAGDKDNDKDKDDDSKQAAVVSAAPDLVNDYLALDGVNFGVVPGLVTLDGHPVVLISWADTQVVVKLPADVVGDPGSYLVTLTRGRAKGKKGDHDDDDNYKRTALFIATIGAVGPQGEKGDMGPKGDKGDKGDTGLQGAQGIQGEKGDKGDVGATGTQGPKGDTGATGATGAQGAQGFPGPQGIQGIQGPQGGPGPQGPPGAGVGLALAATPQFTAQFGSGGGNPFSLIGCPPGQVAVGALVRAGNDMDAFALRCAPVANVGVVVGGLNVQTGAVTQTAIAGNGNGGNPITLSCPAGFAVTGAFGTFTGSMNALALHCSRLGGVGGADTGFGGSPRGAPNYDQSCPAGTAVTGFQGRAGLLVDALQFRCQ